MFVKHILEMCPSDVFTLLHETEAETIHGHVTQYLNNKIVALYKLLCEKKLKLLVITLQQISNAEIGVFSIH